MLPKKSLAVKGKISAPGCKARNVNQLTQHAVTLQQNFIFHYVYGKSKTYCALKCIAKNVLLMYCKDQCSAWMTSDLFE